MGRNYSDYDKNKPKRIRPGKLTPEDRARILEYLKSGKLTQREIAALFKVSTSTIWHMSADKAHKRF